MTVTGAGAEALLGADTGKGWIVCGTASVAGLPTTITFCTSAGVAVAVAGAVLTAVGAGGTRISSSARCAATAPSVVQPSSSCSRCKESRCLSAAFSDWSRTNANAVTAPASPRQTATLIVANERRRATRSSGDSFEISTTCSTCTLGSSSEVMPSIKARRAPRSLLMSEAWLRAGAEY